MQATEVQERTFYSRQAGLQISAVKGTVQMLADGSKIKTGEKIIQFSPRMTGPGLSRAGGVRYDGFGTYVTSDPELIAYLSKREVEVGDVFGPERYRELVTPVEQKMADKDRTIEDQNRLIADLKAKLGDKK